ncbi:cytochrome c-type biogenesis protein CcmB [Thermobaculum terrenum ATCC BAA-798]|uniref:Heme exporter protein B n=1 Tax=Thermobaculum terrenum (strain ATCC BAA-798 / CCMEE 7001 / YNP1) TaxID=525904 RepID=D1CE03_THET1|nr:heme exporter protein CcmB [Thermobaculum terrenum]ACZ41159.1 cytochrome c-type biogenesis protein CcmB [Thermobaculum terrenum ATCC BAA-798]
MKFWQQVLALVHKDLVLEIRRKEIIISMFVFALQILVIFNYAFDLRVENVKSIGPGVIWVSIFFSCAVNVGRTIFLEKERGGWEGLITAPLELGALYVAKLIGNILFMLFAEVLILPMFVVLFNLQVITLPIITVLILGTIGFASISTMFAGLLASTRAREIMLPVLIFPILLPVTIATVEATANHLTGTTAMNRAPWTGLLIAFDALFICAGYILFDQVLEE